MRLIRVGLANTNSTVGAVIDNVTRMIQQARALAAQDVHVVAFPEQCMGGYPAEDYVQWVAFVRAQHKGLKRFAAATSAYETLYAVGTLIGYRNQVYNCAALVYKGRIWGICPKEKLPLYNVFYEGRTLSTGVPYDMQECIIEGESVPFGDVVFPCSFGTVALEVCEDTWSPDGPMRRRCFSGAELVVNLSASPFRLGVAETRTELINTRSSDNHTTVMYVNLVGANDGLVFDGGGLVSQGGRLLLQGQRFVEGTQTVCFDLDRVTRLRTEDSTWRQDRDQFLRQQSMVHSVVVPGPQVPLLPASCYPLPLQRSFFLPDVQTPPTKADAFCEELLQALTLALGDYYQKTGAFQCIGVALSGGRDSLLCLLLAHRYVSAVAQSLPEPERAAYVRQHLYACYMPGPYSSAETQQAAQLICDELGLALKCVSITEAYAQECEAAKQMLPPGAVLPAVTQQNIQARIRGERMWNWANAAQGLFVQTSNMSEKAVGYTTIGGDMMGAFSPIANVPKTVVIFLLQYLHRQQGLRGIQAVLQKPTSAELATGQETEKELMPFPILDACVALYAGEKLAPAEISEVVGQMFPEHPAAMIKQWVTRFVTMFTRSIYKWVQAPLSAHVGTLDLDRERALQLPVVSNPQWHEEME